MRAQPCAGSATAAATAGHLPCFVTHGGDGPSVRLICGFLACDARPFNPLLDSLPPVIKAGRPGGRDTWLDLFARQVMREAVAKRTGGESIIARLSELMFIEVVRQYFEGLPAEHRGRLSGLRDPFISRALSLLHGTPTFDWTVE
ncbi:MAG: cupin domain-containing protein [Cypionkella sp.]